MSRVQSVCFLGEKCILKRCQTGHRTQAPPSEWPMTYLSISATCMGRGDGDTYSFVDIIMCLLQEIPFVYNMAAKCSNAILIIKRTQS